MTCCERPREVGRTVCRDCQRTTKRKLTELGGYLASELEVTLMRSDRTTANTKVKTIGQEQSLPFSEQAGRVLESIRATLTSWAVRIHDEAGAPLPDDRVAAIIEHVTSWLPWLVKHDAGDELVHDVNGLHRAAVAAIDLPPEASRVFIGHCLAEDCDGEMWAHFPRATDMRPAIRCKVCDETYDPEQWHRLGARLHGRQMQQDAARRLAEAIIGKSVG